MTGKTFNGWKVIGFHGKDRFNKSRWLCICTECGREKDVDGHNLRSGRSKKCRPCSAMVVAVANHKTHGLSKTKVYRAWQSMKTRCYNSKQKSTFKYHGAMGVTVHKDWIDNFEAFAEHIGEPPTKYHTVDRIDAFGNYEPGNVRWATQSEQMNNTRNRARAYSHKNESPKT